LDEVSELVGLHNLAVGPRLPRSHDATDDITTNTHLPDTTTRSGRVHPHIRGFHVLIETSTIVTLPRFSSHLNNSNTVGVGLVN